MIDDNSSKTISAIEIIRCVYMKRIMERDGDLEAAQRWQAKVDCWLRRRPPAAIPHGEEGPPVRLPLKPPEQIDPSEFSVSDA